MRLSIELINELVTEIAGEETIPLVEYLRDKHNISEFKIADKLEITVNQVRNLLYRLDEYNLVSFMRKKDKKKGWYEYYWTVNLAKARNLIIDRKRERLAQLRKSLKEEREQQYYYCPNGCVRISGEEALESGFKCTECDEVLQQEDNITRRDNMNAELRKLSADLKEALEAVEVSKEVELGARKKKPAKKPVKKKLKKLKPKKQKKKGKQKKKKAPKVKKPKKHRPKKKTSPGKHKQKKNRSKPKQRSKPQPKPIQRRAKREKPQQQPKAPPKKGFLKKVKGKFFKK